MSLTHPRRVATLGSWSLLLVALAYGAFALHAAWAELSHLVAGVVPSRPRSAPIPFVAHALAGSLALIGGATQLVPAWRAGRPHIHRAVGWLYAAGVFISGLAALRLAVSFAVPVAARLSFGVLALLWVYATLMGVVAAQRSTFFDHREWMMRSYALTLFFVTGSVWMGVFARVPLPQPVTYPLAVTLGWTLNLIAAEAWIRRKKRILRERASQQLAHPLRVGLPT